VKITGNICKDDTYTHVYPYLLERCEQHASGNAPRAFRRTIIDDMASFGVIGSPASMLPCLDDVVGFK